VLRLVLGARREHPSIWFALTDEGDWGDAAVATPWDVYNEPVTIAPIAPIAPIAQRAAQGGHMGRKVGRLDKYVGPNASHQFLLADQLTCTFKQHGEDFQCTTSKRYWLIDHDPEKRVPALVGQIAT